MARLYNFSKSQEISSLLRVANTWWTRTKGLLGSHSLPETEALWIHRCNSIHTFFMRYSIDAIFVNKDLKVQKVYSNLTPWRVTLPVWSAHSVFELPAGSANKLKIEEGDLLHVRD